MLALGRAGAPGRSAPNRTIAGFQINRGGRFWGCCTAQREQARSPRGLCTTRLSLTERGASVASELARAGPGWRSRAKRPQQDDCRLSDKTRWPILGLLHSPARASSLATGAVYDATFLTERGVSVASELARAGPGWRSRAKRPQQDDCRLSDKTRWPILGLLHSPARASSLATGAVYDATFLTERGASVASELARAGARSAPDKTTAGFQINRGGRFWGCCTAQREQARSPRGLCTMPVSLTSRLKPCA